MLWAVLWAGAFRFRRIFIEKKVIQRFWFFLNGNIFNFKISSNIFIWERPKTSKTKLDFKMQALLQMQIYSEKKISSQIHPNRSPWNDFEITPSTLLCMHDFHSCHRHHDYPSQKMKMSSLAMVVRHSKHLSRYISLLRVQHHFLLTVFLFLDPNSLISVVYGMVQALTREHVDSNDVELWMNLLIFAPLLFAYFPFFFCLYTESGFPFLFFTLLSRFSQRNEKKIENFPNSIFHHKF